MGIFPLGEISDCVVQRWSKEIEHLLPGYLQAPNCHKVTITEFLDRTRDSDEIRDFIQTCQRLVFWNINHVTVDTVNFYFVSQEEAVMFGLIFK